MSHSFINPDHHYALLGLPTSASFAEVKAAYRQLVRRYHPDLNPNNPIAEAHLKALNGAYTELCDRFSQPTQPKAKAAPTTKRKSTPPNQNVFYDIFAYAVAGPSSPAPGSYRQQG